MSPVEKQIVLHPYTDLFNLLSTIGGQHAPINIISGGSNSIYADNCDTYFVM